ncbi:hypothetical protein B0J18DRAFT_418657 [Chaetomium sp. MPI-SDFR-AT-0129]|nr:hypothetical protein B0J18DRAFT_418657 [Chaetomium sp. MPI-SDFR-AT-0129]
MHVCLHVPLSVTSLSGQHVKKIPTGWLSLATTVARRGGGRCSSTELYLRCLSPSCRCATFKKLFLFGKCRRMQILACCGLLESGDQATWSASRAVAHTYIAASPIGRMSSGNRNSCYPVMVRGTSGVGRMTLREGGRGCCDRRCGVLGTLFRTTPTFLRPSWRADPSLRCSLSREGASQKELNDYGCVTK